MSKTPIVSSFPQFEFEGDELIVFPQLLQSQLEKGLFRFVLEVEIDEDEGGRVWMLFEIFDLVRRNLDIAPSAHPA